MLVLEQSDFSKVIYYNKNAAYKLTYSALSSLTQKGMLGGILCYLAKVFDYITKFPHLN
jgi:hypothetical protein